MDQADNLRSAVYNRNDSFSLARSISSRVITVTSGKGGVGKTNFAVNLALAFSKMGKRVVLIDADFGLANIEIIFGIIPKYNLADVLNGDRTIEDILIDGQMGVKFISGGSGLKELTNLSDRQMNYIFHNFTYLDKISDVIIIDTGAGISRSVINFVKASSETILVTTPEPTAVTDAYALIKTVQHDFHGRFPETKLVINKVDSSVEGEDIFEKLQKVASKFLGIELKYLGSIPNDPLLVKAVKNQEPVVIAYPNASFSKAVHTIGNILEDPENEGSLEKGSGILAFMKRLVGIS